MCELFGFSAAKKTDITDYLREFFAHSSKHPHGWGLMQEDRCVIKGAEKAADSKMLAELLDTLPPQKLTLAHIRFATVGSVRTENCHPFSGFDISGREWTLIHNGTIYSGSEPYRYINVQSGDTDSERLFLALIDCIDKRLARGALSEAERFLTVERFIREHAPRNKLNLIVTDGELVYVHKNLKNTLSCKRLENGIIFSTEPLDSDGWKPFPMAQVIAFRNGTEVFRGERHKGIFIPSLEYITALDAMNI